MARQKYNKGGEVMIEDVERAIREYFDSNVINTDDLKAAENAILDVLDYIYIYFEDKLRG